MGSGSAPKRHTGRTDSGNTRDVKIQRIGRVTVYKRGTSYYLYFREGKKSVRRKVDGNLATARATAAKVSASLEEGSPSPFGFARRSVDEVILGFLQYCEEVQGLALRTIDRYRAALEHLRQFTRAELGEVGAEQVTEGSVEDFIKWLRRQSRSRNGAKSGEQDGYTDSGIRFILCTSRTAFNWASKRKYLPPYAENPFSAFPIDRTFSREEEEVRIFTPDEQRAFFETCDPWQRTIFLTLAGYGLRVGELVHLLVSDVRLEEAVFVIRSKAAMFWRVKTQRERSLPILPELRGLFERLVGERAEGLLFLNRPITDGRKQPRERFGSAREFTVRLEELADEARSGGASGEKEIKRAVTAFLREVGQIPEKRIRQEFMKLSAKIGCPEVTRVHSLRHLFSTRAQELGMNPLLVQGILGHKTLEMTSKYTHFGMEAKRLAVSQMLKEDPVLRDFIDST